MTDTITARLLAANPVPGTPSIDLPAALLAQIATLPRERASRRRVRALIRRPVLAVAVVMLLLCGIALAANISVSYFGDAGTKPLPKPVRQALLNAAAHRSPTDRLALANTVTAYAYTASNGKRTVYMAPFVRLQGFCAALQVAGKRVQASCVSDSGALATVVGDYGQPWDLRLAPDMHAILGRLAPAAAGDRVVITFEDGTTAAAPMHGRWFAYAVAGLRTQAGHRPSQLTVVHDGHVDPTPPARSRDLQHACGGACARARGRRLARSACDQAVPARRAHRPDRDGGALAASTDLAATRLVGSLAFGHGVAVSVYAAPVTAAARLARGRLDHPRAGQRLATPDPLVQRRARAARHCVRARRRLRVRRSAATPTRCTTSSSAESRSASRTSSVRTVDGHEHAATIFAGGGQWIWLGHDGPALRPVMLIGRDAAGATVVTRRLHGRGGFSH